MPYADYAVHPDGSITIRLTDCRDFAATLRALALKHQTCNVRALTANRSQSITTHISLDGDAAQTISADMVLFFHASPAQEPTEHALLRFTSEDEAPSVITQDEVAGEGVVGVVFE